MTEREEFWGLWHEIAGKIATGTGRDAGAAQAGAWAMFQALKMKQREQQQKTTQNETNSTTEHH